MKKLFCIVIVAMVAPLLSGCFDKGSPADPPSLVFTTGDGRVKLTWAASPSVDYWLFTATDPSLTAFNWTGLPNAHAYISAATPFYVCDLIDATPTYFAANGRVNGGPGGPSSATVTATPYNASANPWTPGVTTLTPNLYGVGYTGLTTCGNNTATSAAGVFAAVGAGGAIFTSADGLTWNTVASPLTSDLYAVTGYAANQNDPGNPALHWVAVGNGGAAVYSLDGITWTAGVSNTPNRLNGVSHGGMYVAVGDSGTIVANSGSGWVVQTSNTTSNLRQAAAIATIYGSIYVAVGDGGSIVTSDSNTHSGIWTALNPIHGNPNLVGVTVDLRGVETTTAYTTAPAVDPWLGFISAAQFVAIDEAGNTYTSVNGHDWTTSASTGVSCTSGTTCMNPLLSSGFGYVTVGNAGVYATAF